MFGLAGCLALCAGVRLARLEGWEAAEPCVPAAPRCAGGGWGPPAAYWAPLPPRSCRPAPGPWPHPLRAPRSIPCAGGCGGGRRLRFDCPTPHPWPGFASPLPTLNSLALQGDAAVGGAYFDPAVRNRTAKIVDFFLKYLTSEPFCFHIMCAVIAAEASLRQTAAATQLPQTPPRPQSRAAQPAALANRAPPLVTALPAHPRPQSPRSASGCGCGTQRSTTGTPSS